ncbi:MAG: hypothetical protein N3G20_02695 [Verrucomicrobiae bacterium]|nr:hypothetical protein [Verrucomicrobiae bacterium]
MHDTPATFSESWYRVAGQRLCLRPSVTVQRQYHRGERWYVLRDPLSNRFFRLRRGAYEFVARLSSTKTVEQVWKECLELFPDRAPGQEAVIHLLAQLYQANLLQYGVGTDTAELFKRYKKTRQRELQGRLLNIMFMRIPLFDPDDFLVRMMPFLAWLISPIGVVLWLAVVAIGLKEVVDNFQSVWHQAEGVIAPANLFLLYVALVIVKTLHEFGHAFFCRRFGGEVHVMGVLFMIFTPIPYMDATSAWGFKDKWKRILVGAAGVLVELFVGGVAAIIWSRTGPGVVHSLAYNVMFIASVSTLVFNLNPLLRFDGYYILSDLLEIPNLSQRSVAVLRHLVEKHLYGLKKAQNPASSAKEAVWLAVYGIASGIYRAIVFGGILLLVADRFLLLGVLAGVACAVAWVAVPIGRLVAYLATSPRLDRHRTRAVVATTGLAGALVVVLEVVPFPHHFRAHGILVSAEWSEVRNETAGILKRLSAQPGETVVEGQPLVELENHELDYQQAAVHARLAEVQARIRQALQELAPNLAPLTNLAQAIALEARRIDTDKSNTIVRARQSGLWVPSGLEQNRGRWVPRGTELGLVISPTAFEFLAIVRQEDADRLFSSNPGKAQVRVRGLPGVSLDVLLLKIIPADQEKLPSRALGWASGGPIPVALNDDRGVQATEPFFAVRAVLATDDSCPLLHGESGQIRFDLPSEPLLSRWVRTLRQLLQKRYQL